MLTKKVPVTMLKAGPDQGLGDGEFTALVSVFGNKDSYGDIVMPGAFADSLAAWKASGNPIPVYYSHRMDDPDYNIGYVLDAEETDKGLQVHAKLDLDDDAVKAKQVYRLLKGGRLTQFSFAYDIEEAAWVETEDDWWYELRKLSLYEVGPTPIGANQETELLAVKSASERARHFAADVKAGRVLSSKNETTLRDAHTQLSAAADQLAEVLATVEAQDQDQEKNAQPTQPAPDETPAEVKSEAPMADGPEDTLRAVTIREKGLRL